MFLLAILAVVSSVVSFASASNNHSADVSRVEYEKKFFDWMQKHGVKPETPEKFVHFLENFIANDQFISRHNADPKFTFTVGHNKFSHLNAEEWKSYVHTNMKRPNFRATKIHEAPIDPAVLPPSIDWTTQNAVTPVKDQGQCGGCWSFSTTGAIEGASAIKYGPLVSLSEQNILDCDTGGTDQGCNGGWVDDAFTFVQSNGGLCTEDAYPYTSGDSQQTGTCQQSSCQLAPHSAPQSFTDVQHNSDSALMSALAQQPVSIAIEADSQSFQMYTSGVYNDPSCGVQLDHAVLAVGYGTESDGDFYIVKNSWGTSWGEDGYILLARGVAIPQGQCGILSAPSYPVV